MKESRFSIWTRRRFGLAAGGSAAALLRRIAGDDASAKNKKKKKCKKSEKRCGKKCVKGACCPGKPCQEDCQCTRTEDGEAFCKPSDERLSFICGVIGLCPPCSESAECENGFVCVKDESFGDVALCQPPCGFML